MKHGVKKIVMLGISALCINAYAVEGAVSTGGAVAGAQIQTPEVKNQMTSEAFLAANKLKSGVVTLPDGLQYKILTEGQGAKPTDSDMVTVDYSGTLVDGTEFDSSYKRGQPATFPVSGVIPGWTEALKLMKVGSTWELYIPATLAYGAEGAPPLIGPNQALVFKVHLIEIKK